MDPIIPPHYSQSIRIPYTKGPNLTIPFWNSQVTYNPNIFPTTSYDDGNLTSASGVDPKHLLPPDSTFTLTELSDRTYKLTLRIPSKSLELVRKIDILSIEHSLANITEKTCFLLIEEAQKLLSACRHPNIDRNSLFSAVPCPDCGALIPI